MDPNRAFKYRNQPKRWHCDYCRGDMPDTRSLCVCGRGTRPAHLAQMNVFRCERCAWKQVISVDAYFNCKCTHCGYEGNGFTVQPMKKGG